MRAAIVEFCENCYDRAKMEEIARRAGIGKSTIYEYFPSKLELLTATGDFVMEQICTDIRQLLQNDRPIRQVLLDYLEYITTVMGTFGSNLINMFGDQELAQIVGKLCEGYIKNILAELERVLLEAQKRGEISAEADTRAAASLILTIPSPPFVRIASKEQLQESFTHMIDLLFSGLLPR